MGPICLLDSRCIDTIPIWVRARGRGEALGVLAMCGSRRRDGGSGRKKP